MVLSLCYNLKLAIPHTISNRSDFDKCYNAKKVKLRIFNSNGEIDKLGIKSKVRTKICCLISGSRVWDFRQEHGEIPKASVTRNSIGSSGSCDTRSFL